MTPVDTRHPGHFVASTDCEVCQRFRPCHLVRVSGKAYRVCGAECERELLAELRGIAAGEAAAAGGTA